MKKSEEQPATVTDGGTKLYLLAVDNFRDDDAIERREMKQRTVVIGKEANDKGKEAQNKGSD